MTNLQCKSKCQQELFKKLVRNVRGLSSAEDLNLPMQDEHMLIYENDGKIYVKIDDKKISYFYTQSNLISHLELLKRMLYNYGVNIIGDSTKDVIEIQKKVKLILKGE